jgi:hypothetical protein
MREGEFMRLTSIFCAILACTAALHAAEPQMVTVRPKEMNDLLANPGMGWQTFHHFADEDKNLAGLHSTSAYFRFYWGDMEPAEGKIDFAKFDALLARAKKAGQKVAFRVMCAGTEGRYLYVPAWLKDSGCKGFEYQYGGGGPKHWVPDFEDPLFQKAHFRFIEEMGKRYDGHPDVDLLDIGSVGLWGEWHMSNTKVDMPTPQMREKIIDAWCKAFPKTPKVMLIGDADGMKHAFTLGAGWRADCLGDMGGFSKTFNHMKNLYPQQIQKSGAADVWKKAPVAFESCWDMRKWDQEKWDIKYIFDYALDCHASYVNNKSAPIPDGTRAEVERFLRKLGYRLVVREFSYPATVTRGEKAAIAMTWENVGVAPPYRDYLLAFHLTGADGKSSVTTTAMSIKGMLPGKRDMQKTLAFAPALSAGRYNLAVGVVDPQSDQPAVRLAIEGRGEAGWYGMGQIEVK